MKSVMRVLYSVVSIINRDCSENNKSYGSTVMSDTINDSLV